VPQFQPGDVIRVWDRQSHPAKFKRLICVSPDRQLFLRINSAPKFKPNHPLRASESNFLDHDSYVELRQLIRPLAYELMQAQPLGRLSADQRRFLVAAARRAATLSPDQKDLIAEAFRL